MANPVFSLLIITAIIIVAISLVLITGKPIIDNTIESQSFARSEEAFIKLNNNINEVIYEGEGSSRAVNILFPHRVVLQDNVAKTEMDTSTGLFDYFSRSFAANIVKISEKDVVCSEETNVIVMENRHIRVELKKIDKNEPLLALDTAKNIVSILEKTSNTTIYPVNSSIVIDNNPKSETGYGFSELFTTDYLGSPLCTAHFYVDSIYHYDIYYKLYSGADFIVVEVRNIIETPEETLIQEPEFCRDGTPSGECVPDNPPKYCEDGDFIDYCQECGCPPGKYCKADGHCAKKEEEEHYEQDPHGG